MWNKLDDTKADLLYRAAQVADLSRHGRGGDPYLGLDVAAFLRRYYRHVAAEDVTQRDPVDLFGAAMSHWQLAAERPQGTALVRVFSPTIEEHGWSSGHTVVQVVTDDMPFLVDSIMGELTRQERSIHLVVHPVFPVRRDITGGLLEVCEPRDPNARSGDGTAQCLESWMYMEVDRETDSDELTRTAKSLQRVLRDVREAVEDWPKVRASALRLADELGDRPPVGLPEAEVAEAQELLRWLADDHFTFLGCRDYVLETTPDGGEALRAVPGTGLGILRYDQPQDRDRTRLSDEVKAKAREKRLLILTKANSRSTVHRNAYLDYVGVKFFDDNGEVVAERRFLGLFTSAAYNESVRRIPVLKRKVAELFQRTGFPPNSHSGKDLLTILETYPRDELFQITVEELEFISLTVLHMQERRQVRVFFRRDAYGRFMSVLVYLPRDRYITRVRLQMEQILKDGFAAESVDFSTLISESVLARLHFVVRTKPGQVIPDVDREDLERQLVAATRSWNDDFADALVGQVGEEEAARLLRHYPDAFPEGYKEDFPARTAVADLRRIDALGPSGALGMNLYTPYGAAPGERRFKLFRTSSVSLADVLPILQEMGVEVLDERPYEVVRADGLRSWVYDFGLRYAPSSEVSGHGGKELFQDGFAAVWSGEAESDGFNALVLQAGLSWRQAVILRSYAKYLRQAGSTFSQDYIEDALTANVGIARLLVELFTARFHPARADGREEAVERLGAEVTGALEQVASLDQDRILRSFLALMRATLRTNFFQAGPDGRHKSYVSFKIDPQAVPDLPQPRPRFEIWVYAPRAEGVHLRFGPVARGGLRWSDRREDFRTEILGLVKAQMVKNAVIVPTGAKGGFIVKRPPADPTDRDAVLAEGIACYQTFISGLLDVTDNLKGGQRIPPPDVVRHDGDDPYLVVAADKGTATFSDIANGVATRYGFWLGDAFASGGSAGYDHKAMGITARGAWESVKRHFREMGHDTQSEDFTVVGVGDMSGDVFGNGMLLSEHILLVAAFDHRHVFLDPNPDARTSYAERRRLFDLPRSSWADYDPQLISEGGGIYPRTAKSVPITPQVRARLGLPDDVRTLTPAELLRGILGAPVDLLWNGGIGTYVKASTETHADVGDKANDAIRVNASQLRCRVVGEGGNLGMTQLGRIEFASAGGHVNTDAIDNSAGVDTSDHEVNIKILLDRIVQDGDLTEKQRNALLSEMTEEVGRLVLRDNYEQNVLLGNARFQAGSMLSVHRRFVRVLEERGDLDRALEFLPTDAAMADREAAGLGLTSPEFAVLMAYSKITLKRDLLNSDLPDEPWFGRVLRSYFPSDIVERYGERLDEHPLRREIITTCVVNDLVNRGGITFVFRASEETGADAADVARAFTIAREVFGFLRFWEAIQALDNKLSTEAQTMLHLEGRRLLDRTTRWLLQTRRSGLDVRRDVEHFGPDVAALSPHISDLLQGNEQHVLRRRAVEFEDVGVPADLALHAAGLLYSFSLLEIVEIANSCGRPAADVADVYFALSERFAVDRILTRITALPRGDRWQSLARSALRYDLYAALAGLTAQVLSDSVDGAGAVERIASWEKHNAQGLARSRATLDEVMESESFDLATLSVALRVIRTLLPT